jgi:hypothetical protein
MLGLSVRLVAAASVSVRGRLFLGIAGVHCGLLPGHGRHSVDHHERDLPRACAGPGRQRGHAGQLELLLRGHANLPVAAPMELPR